MRASLSGCVCLQDVPVEKFLVRHLVNGKPVFQLAGPDKFDVVIWCVEVFAASFSLFNNGEITICLHIRVASLKIYVYHITETTTMDKVDVEDYESKIFVLAKSYLKI